ncbi:MAG TPA: gliding motility protein GldN [Cytophagaceae bacterium]|jgi:gliding motility associated protien GldN|nr:gliding motility protein GldN [Cytophagaceae bacterium]
MKKLGVILVGLTMSLGVAYGQERVDSVSTTTEGSSNGDTGYNPLSVRPVHISDIMWKKGIVRAMDLREKQNTPLFSKNRELTKLILEAVLKGDITPYTNDSIASKLTMDDFNTNLLMPSDVAPMTQEEKEITFAQDGDSSIFKNSDAESYTAKDIYMLQLTEDMLFDKQRSRLYYDILAVTIMISPDHPRNTKGIEVPIASFSYKELVEKVFKDNPKAIWFNVQNDQQHKNLADAFDLRLFSSYIIKVSNPNDARLVDIYDNDQEKGIRASQWAAMEILEYEHNLWEF